MVGLMVYQYAAIVYFYFSIGRLESIKQALYELVILPLRKPELFLHEKLLGPQKGVLLNGPPGTGKTMLAKAIIREFGAVFINMRISNLMSKWFGDAQKLGEYRSHLNCLSCA
jgi:SpoVK/Ycf46/Vps4 family AAA+-type ATPase